MNVINPYIHDFEPHEFIYKVRVDAGVIIEAPTGRSAELSYNFIVDWGDGSPESIIRRYDSPLRYHTYAVAGDYVVTMTGVYDAIFFPPTELPHTDDTLIEIMQWGTMPFKGLSFANCLELKNISALDAPNLTNIRNFVNLFLKCRKLESITKIADWNISHIETFGRCFLECRKLEMDISSWRPKKTAVITEMFDECYKFNCNLNDWAMTPNNLRKTFHRCWVLNTDLDKWDVSGVSNFQLTFWSCYKFNGDITGWDMSNATNIGYMIGDCTDFNQDISNWDTSNVTTMQTLLYKSTSFDQDISKWNFESCIMYETNNGQWFADPSGLSKANYDKLLIAWNTQAVPYGLRVSVGQNYTLGSAAETARDNLINVKGWDIYDLGGI